MAKLNKKEPYGLISGDTQGRVFEQNGKFFDGQGDEWVDPSAPKKTETKAEREAREKAEKAEADRLAAEAAESKKKADAGGNDQVNQQLAG